MQISLRSQMIAGTAAIVGASAIAMTPVMATPLTLPSVSIPAAAQVAMAAFSSPLAQLSETLELINLYTFDGFSDPTAVTSWPFANFGTEFGTPLANLPGVIPAVLGPVSFDPLNPYAGFGTGLVTSVGVVPQFIDLALPIISQLGYNGSQYLNVTLAALAASGVAIGEGLTTAIGDLLTLNISGAVTAISDAINTVGTTLLGAGGYVLQSVLANAQAVGNTVLGNLPTVLGVVSAQFGVVLAKDAEIITAAVTSLLNGDIEGWWNATVDGLTGPSGVPGVITSFVLGEGVQTGPIAYSADPDTVQAEIQANFVPSDRVLLQTFMTEIAADLTTAPPPVAALKSARSAASVRSAAATEVAATEVAATEVAATEAPATESSAPVKHRKARGSAQRAAANN